MIDQRKTAERRCRWVLASHAATDKGNSSDVTMDHAEGKEHSLFTEGNIAREKEKK